MTGPVGSYISDAIRNHTSVANQTEVLWTVNYENITRNVKKAWNDQDDYTEHFNSNNTKYNSINAINTININTINTINFAQNNTNTTSEGKGPPL